ncbi:hypothetical protein Bpla01_56180 [Burkholderia plantarii]|nr:YCII-like protein [Burkholderia plantarii]GLZ22089.1 hypothetical protein Bpla01_56180 [Burkholderia plantarii]
MRHVRLFFDFAPGFASRRERDRESHPRVAWAAGERGELVLAGALTDPPDAGLLLRKADSIDTVEKSVRQDPHVACPVVRWRIRERATAVGADAAAPAGSPHGGPR